MSKNNYSSKEFSLNRSFSFSGSKVCLEESFKNHKGEILVRQYSCEQIYDPSKQTTKRQLTKQSYLLHGPNRLDLKIPPFEQSPPSITCIPKLSSDRITSSNLQIMSSSSNFNFSKKCPEQKGFKESLMCNRNRYQEIVDESSPMEVDTSIDETAMTDVHSPNSSTSLGCGDIREHRNKVSKLLISPSKSKVGNSNVQTNNRQFVRESLTKYLKLSAIFIIPIACAMLLMHTHILFSDDATNDCFNAENITDALQDLLYGQQDVINTLKESFRNIDDNQLIIFTGGIGVGKTYAANIISNNFPWKDNIIKIVSPQHKNYYQESNFLRSLSRYGYNLLVIDGLEFQDRQSVIPFVNKFFNTNKKVIVLLIFTIPEYTLDLVPETNFAILSESSQISSELADAKLNNKLIIFNRLPEDIVRRCIRYAMAKKGLIINQYNIDHILQNVNYAYSGCKGVYSKVALLK